MPQRFHAGRIGIVTVTYNGARVLPGFFASLDASANRNWALYAVDNASQDATLPMLRAWQQQQDEDRCVVLALPENSGVGAANNVGTLQAIEDGCEFVLHINNDVEFGPEMLDELVTAIGRYSADMVTPLTYFYSPPDVVWAAGGYFQPRLAYRNLHIGEGKLDKGQFAISRAVRYAPTSCMMFRREVFARAGLMEERYFLYHDDSDLMLRAWKAGLTLYYVAEAKMWHKVSSIAGARPWATARFGIRGRALFIRKFCGPLTSAVFSVLYRVYFLLRWIARKDSTEFLLLKQKVWTEGMRMGRNAPGPSVAGRLLASARRGNEQRAPMRTDGIGTHEAAAVKAVR